MSVNQDSAVAEEHRKESRKKESSNGATNGVTNEEKPANLFVDTKVHPHRDIARLLAVASGYAYTDSNEVMKHALTLNWPPDPDKDPLEKDLRVRKFAHRVDALRIESTAYLIQAYGGRVAILCYRGTKPTDLISMVGSLDSEFNKVNFPEFQGPSSVHAGFYRNFLATFNPVIDALRCALRGDPIDPAGDQTRTEPLEALYITGHSLGGAMASLMAVTLIAGEEHDLLEQTLRAVYTFGQPLIADPEFAAKCEEKLPLVRDRRGLIRFVYRHDAAPHLPFRMEGEFKHFGVEYRYLDDEWEFAKNVTSQALLAGFSDTLVGLTGRFAILRPLRDQIRRLPFLLSLDDHNPQNYIDALTVKSLK
jgi:hypothetical protein